MQTKHYQLKPNLTMRTNKAKQQAILDIQDDLARENKCFFAFVKKLNGPIGTLVTEHINEQMKIKSKKSKV